MTEPPPFDYNLPGGGGDLEWVLLPEDMITDMRYAVKQYAAWAALEGRKDVARRYEEILYQMESDDE